MLRKEGVCGTVGTMPLLLIPEIHRATHQIGLHIEKCPGMAVSQGEAHILAFLNGSGPRTIAEVRQALAHKRSTLTSLLDRLEVRGWLRREIHPANRKTFLIRLTPAGRKAAARVTAWMESWEAAVLGGVTGARIQAAADLLARFRTPERDR